MKSDGQCLTLRFDAENPGNRRTGSGGTEAIPSTQCQYAHERASKIPGYASRNARRNWSSSKCRRIVATSSGFPHIITWLTNRTVSCSASSGALNQTTRLAIFKSSGSRRVRNGLAMMLVQIYRFAVPQAQRNGRAAIQDELGRCFAQSRPQHSLGLRKAVEGHRHVCDAEANDRKSVSTSNYTEDAVTPREVDLFLGVADID